MPNQKCKWSIQTAPKLADLKPYMEAGLSRLSAITLKNRGIGAESLKAHTTFPLASLPDPFLMHDMEKAANAFADAIESSMKGVCYADYDCDGTMSGAILCRFAQMVGGSLDIYIPHRVNEGYGLSMDAIHKLAEDGFEFVVTVDTGITGVREADLAVDLGLKLVITDHHKPGEVLPDAIAVVDPHISGCQYPFKPLAGVGVAFNLVIATRKVLRDRGYFNADRPEPNVATLLPLVAIGSICDIVNLGGTNRILTARGIKAIREKSHSIIGIEALCSVSNIQMEKVTSGDIGFQLGPRLNAGGRMATGETAFRLMMTDDPDEANALAAELDQFNTERKDVEEELTALAFSMIEDNPAMAERKTIVLASDRFVPAVQGIVASRVLQRYSKPVIVISIEGEYAKGSGRSVSSFDLFTGLTSCGEYLSKFGGHPKAAGLTIPTANIELFADALERAASHLTEDDLKHEISVDAEVSFGDVTLVECDNLSGLEPFGEGYSRPLFCARNCTVVSAKTLKEKHLKLSLVQEGVPWTVDAIAFGRTSDGLPPVIDVVFSMEINEWNGNKKPQMMVRDFRGSR